MQSSSLEFDMNWYNIGINSLRSNSNNNNCNHPFCISYKNKDQLHGHGDESTCFLYGSVHLSPAVLSKMTIHDLSSYLDVHDLVLFGKKKKQDYLQMVLSCAAFEQPTRVGKVDPSKVDTLLKRYGRIYKGVSEFEVTALKSILLKYGVEMSDCKSKPDLVRKVEETLKKYNPDFFKGPSSTGQPENDDDDDENENVCKVCYQNLIDVVLLECGHLVTCSSCSRSFANCPMCGRKIDRVVRTYKP